MFKRLRWMLVGAAAGAGGSIWARRRVRQSLERYLPGQLTAEARARFERAGRDVRAALSEGRRAMADAEVELRSRLPDPGGGRRALPRGTVIEARSLEQVARGRPELAGRCPHAPDTLHGSWTRTSSAAPSPSSSSNATTSRWRPRG